MTRHHQEELQRAQWDAYMARKANRSAFGKVMASPVTFGVAVAGIVCCVVAALWIGA